MTTLMSARGASRQAAFFEWTVANGALRTWLDLQLAPPVRSRDGRYRPPPAQNRASGIPARGSHLGCVTAKRICGHG